MDTDSDDDILPPFKEPPRRVDVGRDVGGEGNICALEETHMEAESHWIVEEHRLPVWSMPSVRFHVCLQPRVYASSETGNDLDRLGA